MILPPTGMAVATVKPSVTLPVLTVPEAVSPGVVKAMPTPDVSCPPSATVDGATANAASVEVDTWKVLAA